MYPLGSQFFKRLSIIYSVIYIVLKGIYMYNIVLVVKSNIGSLSFLLIIWDVLFFFFNIEKEIFYTIMEQKSYSHLIIIEMLIRTIIVYHF